MCVIVYKPSGTLLPSKNTLKKCFDKNPDGAGFMLPVNNKVVIKKGFMKFKDFTRALGRTIFENGLDPVTTPIVLHFRISTQGGVNAPLCHPYPVCESYDEMRKLDTTADIGLCHNGIISRCSESRYAYSHWDAKTKSWVSDKVQPKYNDTMTFIKDYASLIIDGDQDFANNKNKVTLLERLCEYSKLAIMNANGDVKLIGAFYEKGGRYYSNLYAFETPKVTTPYKSGISYQPSSGFKSTGEIIKSSNFDDIDEDYERLIAGGDY